MISQISTTVPAYSLFLIGNTHWMKIDLNYTLVKYNASHDIITRGLNS